jgi:DNA-directed RNA polymerase specialized sigma24 family protein
LRALLYRRGLDAPSAEDIVQEVALRALANDVTYASAQDLLRWAGPVACNLHVDLIRHRARMFDGELATDHPASNDVAGEVADRIELQRALRGIAALRPADRAAIIDAVAENPAPPSRKEAVRLAVRRHRARSRLLVVLEQLAGVFAPVRWLRRGKRGAAVALAAVTPVVVLPLVVGGHLHSHHAALPPVTVTQAARLEVTGPVHVDRTTPPVMSNTVWSHTRVTVPTSTTKAAAKPNLRPTQFRTKPVNRLGHAEYESHDQAPDEPTICFGPLPVAGVICSPV